MHNTLRLARAKQVTTCPDAHSTGGAESKSNAYFLRRSPHISSLDLEPVELGRILH